MGEVVISSFKAMEIDLVVDDKNMEKKLEIKESSTSCSMVKWDNFLPKNGLRILLVEADDSTRQIIAALLRKCSYKVATAPDGLKAWEVLKARPRNIDLILTEMELPSISGYALLTLIMEHEICKNIPVIMMSKDDSVSMVYKCMTRGAADFLVKPIRINELKNLWQHVWRRQSASRCGYGPQNDSVAQEKLEVTAENNATSDHSSGSKACAPMQEDCLKKGSDAQSSCGKLNLEVESAYTAEMEDYSQPKQGLSPVTELRVGQNLSTPESAAADTAAYKGNRALDRQERLERQSHAENVNLCAQTRGNQKVITNSPREAIDLIGAFDNHSRCHSNPNDGANRYDSSPHLDLSLTGCSLIALENKTDKENQLLNRSNTSAFTRYVNKTLHASTANSTPESAPKHNQLCSVDHVSDNNAPESISNPGDSSFVYNKKVLSVPVNRTTETEQECRNVSQKSFPIPLYMGGLSQNSANQLMSSYHQSNADIISKNNYNFLDNTPRISSSEPSCRQEQNLESLEDQARFSATDQCTSTSLCNGPKGGNEQAHDLSRQRSLLREAALNKFRLKRKERCFDKKVRYESRKKLAEQRPRVKGQFVRQVPPDPPPPKC